MINEMSEIRMRSNGGGPIERRGGWATTNKLFDMGPPLYNRVVYKTVFGRKESGHGNIKTIVDDMRTLQREAGGLIATAQFVDQCHSFLADPFPGCKSWGREELYEKYNMTRWSPAVKARWADAAGKKRLR